MILTVKIKRRKNIIKPISKFIIQPIINTQRRTVDVLITPRQKASTPNISIATTYIKNTTPKTLNTIFSPKLKCNRRAISRQKICSEINTRRAKRATSKRNGLTIACPRITTATITHRHRSTTTYRIIKIPVKTPPMKWPCCPILIAPNINLPIHDAGITIQVRVARHIRIVSRVNARRPCRQPIIPVRGINELRISNNISRSNINRTLKNTTMRIRYRVTATYIQSTPIVAI